jgi:hypothetical protein
LTAEDDTLLMFYLKHALPPDIRKVEFLLGHSAENICHRNKQGETILDIAFKKLGQDRLGLATLIIDNFPQPLYIKPQTLSFFRLNRSIH